MKISILFILMLYMHIIDDYVLQGCLANLKQKSWWENNYSDKKYKYDYLAGLFFHSLSWAISIILPVIILYTSCFNFLCCLLVIVNMIIHFIVDDLKANKKVINLIIDQSIHLFQILISFILIICFVI